MLGALVSAGASLVSGLFGRSDAKKEAKKEEKALKAANAAAVAAADKMNKEIRARADAAALVPVKTERESTSTSSGSVDMAAFMKAAEDNGFNPLTFLRSGALSLFAKSTSQTAEWSCTTGERAVDAALAGQNMPSLSPVISSTKVPSVGSIFGDALTTGVNKYLNDKSIADNNKFQMDLLNRQMSGANKAGAYSGSRSGYTPSAVLYGSTSKTKTPLGGSNTTSTFGKTPAAAFEPVTEFDDAITSIDQLNRFIKQGGVRSAYEYVRDRYDPKAVTGPVTKYYTDRLGNWVKSTPAGGALKAPYYRRPAIKGPRLVQQPSPARFGR